ncbi:MAG: hypothetical protein V1862_08975, partial [Methanobacteriota archaeon]
MITTLNVVFDGMVFRPINKVDLVPGKEYTIIINSETGEEQDVQQDPAFDIASLAVDTNIPDLSTEHDHYLYGVTKRV